MALRKATEGEVAAAPADAAATAVADAPTTPVFEAPEVGALEIPVAGLEPEAEAPAQQVAEAAKTTSTAIAKAKTSAVSAPRKLVGAFSDLQNVIALEDVESMGVGAFPRVTVDLGGFMLDKEEIGTEIRLELMSWNFRYMVTTGANDEEAKKKVKISYDGETVMGTGERIADAVAAFKEEGYEKAECKTYADLWGSLAFKGGEDIAPEDRPIVQVQLSPESLKKFKAFQTEVGFKAGKGLIDLANALLITIKSNRGEFSGNRFGFMTFSITK